MSRAMVMFIIGLIMTAALVAFIAGLEDDQANQPTVFDDGVATEASTGPGTDAQLAAGECNGIAGEWVLDTYKTDMTTASGSLSNVHNNAGKTMIIADDCKYSEDFSTEYFVPERHIQQMAAAGLDANVPYDVYGSGSAETITCDYVGLNTGTIEIDSSDLSTIEFVTDSVNNISGSCDLGGAMATIGSTHTPGIGNTAVKLYSYVLDGDKLTLQSHFEPQPGTVMDTTLVYKK